MKEQSEELCGSLQLQIVNNSAHNNVYCSQESYEQNSLTSFDASDRSFNDCFRDYTHDSQITKC